MALLLHTFSFPLLYSASYLILVNSIQPYCLSGLAASAVQLAASVGTINPNEIMNPDKPYLSVVVPVYNESKRIGGIVRIVEYMRRQPYESEVVVVDDGSSDDTLTQLHALQQQCPFKIITYATNRGKGYAIQQGMVAAHGQFRLFSDVDLSTPLDAVEKFLPYLAEWDVIIASRKQPGTSIVVHQPILRETLGRGFTRLSQLILQVPVTDFTCGFKCFSERAAQAIFPRMTIERWGFDAEVLFIAQRLRFPIKEIPVQWTNDPRTKVKLPGDIIRSLKDLLSIRLNGLAGKYN